MANMEQAYAAIGRAVISAQLFEITLISVFEFFKMQTKPGYREKTGGFISAGAFKVPISNIVDQLRLKGDIAADLEARLTEYIDARNLLIHRWTQEHGWPDDDDHDGFAPIIGLAIRVEVVARNLRGLFAHYMVDYANPEWAEANPEEYQARMKELFHRAHVS